MTLIQLQILFGVWTLSVFLVGIAIGIWFGNKVLK